MKTFITFDEARAIVLSRTVRTAEEQIPLSEALGRTLSRPICADLDIPPFANSAMDGYAVRSVDCSSAGAMLTTIGHIPAGRHPTETVKEGTCVSIMTGAPLPEGADAVVPIEWCTQSNEATVTVDRPIASGRHVRPAAQDLAAGDDVFEAGTVCTPPVVGMLATLGVDPVPVRGRPRVAVISTGDEIVAPDCLPGPGQIRNSNGPALRVQVIDAGGRCDAYQHARDDRNDIRKTIERAGDTDLMIFSGGVSVGRHDHVKEVLDALGLDMQFWKVRQRPGKPLSFGWMEGVPVLGLPGNPVSSAMCFEMYARPLLAAMLGRTRIQRSRFCATTESAIDKVEELTYFMRGRVRFVEGTGYLVRETGPQGSNLYGSVVDADCIVHLPAGVDRIEAGAHVQCEWLDWGRLG